jgi:hypothetical protein
MAWSLTLTLRAETTTELGNELRLIAADIGQGYTGGDAANPSVDGEWEMNESN